MQKEQVWPVWRQISVKACLRRISHLVKLQKLSQVRRLAPNRISIGVKSKKKISHSVSEILRLKVSVVLRGELYDERAFHNCRHRGSLRLYTLCYGSGKTYISF